MQDRLLSSPSPLPCPSLRCLPLLPLVSMTLSLAGDNEVGGKEKERGGVGECLGKTGEGGVGGVSGRRKRELG